jgi:hypothetical protein
MAALAPCDGGRDGVAIEPRRVPAQRITALPPESDGTGPCLAEACMASWPSSTAAPRSGLFDEAGGEKPGVSAARQE